MALTTWKFTNASVVLNAKASAPADIAMTIHADTIVRNDKPLSGRVVNLTRQHLLDMASTDGAGIKINDKDRTVTVTRQEGTRGRKTRVGATADAVSQFLASLNS